MDAENGLTGEGKELKSCRKTFVYGQMILQGGPISLPSIPGIYRSPFSETDKR